MDEVGLHCVQLCHHTINRTPLVVRRRDMIGRIDRVQTISHVLQRHPWVSTVLYWAGLMTVRARAIIAGIMR